MEVAQCHFHQILLVKAGTRLFWISRDRGNSLCFIIGERSYSLSPQGKKEEGIDLETPAQLALKIDFSFIDLFSAGLAC